MYNFGISSWSQIKAQTKYDRDNSVRYYLKLNIRTDASVIKWLNAQSNIQGSIKHLILEELKREQEDQQ